MLAFAWPEPPEFPVLDRGPGTQNALGVIFTVAAPAPCPGVRWRVPTTASLGELHQVALWLADTAQLLAFGNYFPAVDEQGTDVDVLFRTGGDGDPLPVDLTLLGTNYMASVFTPRYYVATRFQTWPRTEGILTAHANNGWYRESGGMPDSLSPNQATYHVSPLIQIDVDSVLTAGLPALTGAFTGDSQDEAGVGALLPAFGASFVGDAVTAGQLAAVLPALVASLTDAVPQQPGVLVASGTTRTLTAAGSIPGTLTAAGGTGGTLTASGRP